MPRGARLDTPGTLHHVIVRGIERRNIVDDKLDRENFVGRLGLVATETNTAIYAWALMSNHAHLLMGSGPGGIATFMGRILTGHAISYNRRHRRHGHPFQNRYKSIICEEDAQRPVSSETDLTFTVPRGDFAQAIKIEKQVMEDTGAEEVYGDDTISKVSVIGVGMRNHSGVAARMFQVLSEASINIIMISTSEIRISCVIDEIYTELAKTLGVKTSLDPYSEFSCSRKN